MTSHRQGHHWICATLLLVCVGLTGCADNLSGNVYTREEARRPMHVQHGYVDSVRPVVIEGERGFIGQAGGGVIGGVAGSAVGAGRGSVLASAVGAIAGAVAGGAAQERLTRAQGADITVRLDNGDVVSVVQQVESLDRFRPGQRVRITRGNDGAARVMPLQAPPGR